MVLFGQWKTQNGIVFATIFQELRNSVPWFAELPYWTNSVAPTCLNGLRRLWVGRIHPDIMARTAAFLLLKDSKAYYAIEGEKPPQNRAQRWGRAIGLAGQKPITTDELIRLQQIVIDNPRFTKMGYREQEGFVGEHDHRHGTPIPDHISARWKDVQQLADGLIATGDKLEKEIEFDAVVAAATSMFLS